MAIPERGDPTPIRVLLVEDNPDDAMLIQEELSELDGAAFEIHHELELGAGMRRLSEDRFDAVVVDLSLPDFHGVSVIRQVRRRFPDVPIVVLSGHDEAAFASSSLDEGAEDYVAKGRGDFARVGRSILYAIRRKRARSHGKALEERTE